MLHDSFLARLDELLSINELYAEKLGMTVCHEQQIPGTMSPVQVRVYKNLRVHV